jgi:hypothetical protein
MNRELEPLAAFATDQHGNVTTTQAHTAGLTNRRIRQRVTERVLERAGPHVLRSPFVDRTPLGDLSALLLGIGADAVASGTTALALHEFEGFTLGAPFHITTLRGRNIERPPHHIHTTIDLPAGDCTLVHGIRAMTPVRALVDASRQLSSPKLTVAYDGGLRDRKYTEDMVHERIVELRTSGRPGIPKLLAVIEGSEVIRGGHSWLERRFLRLCADNRLPRPETQQVLASSKGKLIRVDFRFPDTLVVGEVLGYRWHRGDRKQFSRDVERMNALVSKGFVPLQFTYDHVTLDEAWVVAQLRSALGS